MGIGDALGKRVTVRMDGELGKYITELKAETRAATPSEVVRRALALYYVLVNEKKNGSHPVLMTEVDGERVLRPLIGV